MLRPLPALLLVALCLPAALPAAEAQVPGAPADPSMTVRLDVTPKSPTVLLGGVQAFQVNVIVGTQFIFCNSPSTVTVTLALQDAGLAGVAGTLPASVEVPIRANVQPPAAQTASGGNATATLVVAVARTASPDHDHAFTVTATTPAALPSGCNALTPNAPKAATGTAEVKMRTGPPGIVGGTGTTSATCPAGATTSGAAAGAPSACPTTQASFFVPIQLQVALLLGAGLLRRRR